MENLLDNLNPAQQQAVTHDQGPLLIVAGAGTGKTTVITRRIAYLITQDKCQPEEILALTFTDKAAGEMEERVDQLLPYGYVDLWINTFHAFAERILQDHALEIGLPNNFKLLNDTAQWLLVRQNLDRFNLDYYRPLGNPTKFIHALLKHFSRAKDENITPQDYLDYVQDLKLNADNADYVFSFLDKKSQSKLSDQELKEVLAQEIKKQTEVAEAYHVYQQLLLDNEALDFGDLINYCLKLLKDRKNLLAQYRSQFKYILVDEFQDTNYAQYELLKLLAAPDNNLTVVGDDDQSIYKFRGASISNILQFKDDYPALTKIYLTDNYRSQQEILDLAYNFIQKNNPYRLEVKLQEETGFSKQLKSQVEGQAEILHLHGQSLTDEIKLVIEKIIELYNASDEVSWSDFGILVRANSSADDFCYFLDQAKIPYMFLASKGLFVKSIVLDILAYLRLLDDYHESSAVYRVLSLPVWNLNSKDIINLNYWSRRKGWSLFETMRQVQTLNNISEAGQEVISKILALVEKHAQLVRENKKATEIIQVFLTDSGYLKDLTSEENEANLETLNYLNQYYKFIQKFEQETPDPNLKNFLNYMELELEAGDQGQLSQNLEIAGPDTVKIMTIHAAKGLEFKYVFSVNLVDKRFPTIRRGEPIALPEKLVKEITPEGDFHLMEERRLFYVALTRAKNGLYLSSAEDYGGARKKKISKFLVELSEVDFKLAPEVEIAKAQLSSPKKKEAKVQDYTPVKRFSFTQLRAYENCPYQYRFAHILKIPITGKAQFSYGKTLHSTLQKFFDLVKLKQGSQQIDLFGLEKEDRSEVTSDQLLEIYEQEFVDDWFQDQKEKDSYYLKGKESLKKFFEHFLANKPKPKYLEQPFNFRLGKDGEYIINGKIDRIDDMDGQVRIVDYKTGTPKEKLSAEDKEQLLLYQMASERVLKEPVGELAFYYLDNSQEISFLGTDKDLEKYELKILGIIEKINSGQFPAKPSQLCGFCDFRRICEYRQS